MTTNVKVHLSLTGKYVRCNAHDKPCPRGGHQVIQTTQKELSARLKALTEEHHARQPGQRLVPEGLSKKGTKSSGALKEETALGEDPKGFRIEPKDFYSTESRTYRHMSRQEVQAWQREARRVVGFMPKTHQDALRRYSSESYQVINTALRDAQAKQVSPKFISTLDKAIKNAGVGEERLLYRGMRFNMGEEYSGETPQPYDKEVKALVEKHFPVGTIWRDPAYLSTSMNPGSAANRASSLPAIGTSQASIGVVLEINSSEGCPVPNQDWPDETEILLPRDAQLQVEEVVYDSFMHNTEGQVRPVIVVRARHLPTS